MKMIIFPLIIVVIILLALLVKIPVAHYGVEVVLGKRTGRKFKEGLHLFCVPFLSKMLLYSKELRTYTFDGKEAAVVFSSDNMEITIEGAVLLRPSWKNLLDFVEIPESTIEKGMKDAIEGGLGEVAGQEKGEGFISYKKEITYIINCLFRLKRRPDYFLNQKEKGKDFPLTMDTPSYKEYLERVRMMLENEEYSSDEEREERIKKMMDRLSPNEWEIKTKIIKTDKKDGTEEKEDKEVLDVLNFYQKNVRRIETMLQLENSLEENSGIEQEYSIEIESFKLAKVTYSPETKKSLEKKKQAEVELRASKLRQQMKMEVFNELTSKGVPASQASNDADAMVGIAPKQTIAGNAIPIVNFK